MNYPRGSNKQDSITSISMKLENKERVLTKWDKIKPNRKAEEKGL